jgi:hypothetical protein
MQSLVKADRRDIEHTPHRFLKVLAVAIVVLILSVVTALTYAPATTTVSSTDADVEAKEPAEPASAEEPSNSVAVKLDLEEGDVIDLAMARGDVVVDEWAGDDVLVILERLKGVPASPVPSRSVNIKVTRRGHNVRIATVDDFGQPINDPTLSLRIMVPQRRAAESSNVGQIYDLSKLTAVVFKALHREALKWITR